MIIARVYIVPLGEQSSEPRKSLLRVLLGAFFFAN